MSAMSATVGLQIGMTAQVHPRLMHHLQVVLSSSHTHFSARYRAATDGSTPLNCIPG
jgi:hypothetical protein